MKVLENSINLLKDGYVCDSCLGRSCASLLTGYTNKERGQIIRQFVALLIDSGEKIDVDTSNFYGMKFRNAKLDAKKPAACKVCKNFFLEKIDDVAKNIAKKLEGIEFATFQIGTMLSDELAGAEEKFFEASGIEFVEPMKTEVNREIGKLVEKLTKKTFDAKNPDVTILVDMKAGSNRIQIKSLYIFGKYQKLVRGVPQTKWICSDCKGKGCKKCKGQGKLYKTSVQEEIEKPLLKAAGSAKSSFHGLGREDVDARCLGHRPFVIELHKPLKRKIDLKKLERQINKSKKVKVKPGSLKFVDKEVIKKIKAAKIDKIYLATVVFAKKIDRSKTKELKSLVGAAITQKTPQRVVHRRSDKYRKRTVKNISWKLLGNKKMQFKITAESGLYIKELLNGDNGRTKPNIAELLGNSVKKIELDVIEIKDKRQII